MVNFVTIGSARSARVGVSSKTKLRRLKSFNQPVDLGDVLLGTLPWTAHWTHVLAFLALVLRPAVLELLEDLESVVPAHCSGSKGLAQVILGLRSSLPDQKLSGLPAAHRRSSSWSSWSSSLSEASVSALLPCGKLSRIGRFYLIF